MSDNFSYIFFALPFCFSSPGRRSDNPIFFGDKFSEKRVIKAIKYGTYTVRILSAAPNIMLNKVTPRGMQISKNLQFKQHLLMFQEIRFLAVEMFSKKTNINYILGMYIWRVNFNMEK